MEARAGAEAERPLLELAASELGHESALVHAPARARNPFLDDGAPPRLVLQLYFSGRDALEAAAARLRSLVRLDATQLGCEAMQVQRFEVPDPAIRAVPWCTYLVRYEGPAEDPQAWHAHYLAHHPGLMARLPGIRELEIYTPMDLAPVLPGGAVRSLQR